MDNWDRKTSFGCDTCMYYVPKADCTGRCRNHAPTMKGYPVVLLSDWCGEHKVGSNPIREDGTMTIGSNSGECFRVDPGKSNYKPQPFDSSKG